MGDVEKKPVEGMSFAEFLSKHPPGVGNVKDLLLLETALGGFQRQLLSQPNLQLDCNKCGGLRWFECIKETELDSIRPARFYTAFLEYSCKNCEKELKVFAIAFYGPVEGMKSADVFKIGEHPPFGPRTPARLITLIGPDRDLFLKGRKAENQGLGIGAFAYYRRVVERQKNRLLDEIIKVCKQLGSQDELIKDLDAAKKETQFSRAVDDIKHSLPDSLMIGKHNPLKLLHGPLSVGMHELSDEQCLEMATDIRHILAALAERVAELLKDQKDLNASISRLTQLNPKKK